MLVSLHLAMTLPNILSNPTHQDPSKMADRTVDDLITKFVNNKFRISRSFATKRTYTSSIKRFNKFVIAHYGYGVIQLLHKIKANEIDPIEVLDNYYTFLSNYKRPKGTKVGYSSVATKKFF